MRCRSDRMARSMCGNTSSSSSHSSAGASNQVSTSRRRHTGRGGNGATGCGSAMHGRSVAGKADRASRIEAEEHALTDLEVSEAAGLGQCHAELEAAALLVEQYRGVGTIEQQALHGATEPQVIGPQLLGYALEAHDFRAHEHRGRIAHAATAAVARAHDPT